MVFSLSLLLALLVHAGPENDTDLRAPGARVETFSATLLARPSADIPSEREGRIEAFDVEMGAEVTANQRIAHLDVSLDRADAARAEMEAQTAKSALDRAKTQLRSAEQALQRTQSFGARLAESALTDDLAKQTAAQKNVARAGANLGEKELRSKDAKRRVERAEIKTLIGGTVTAKLLNPGAWVAAGTPLLHVANLHEVTVHFSIPQERRGEFPLERVADVRCERLPGQVRGRVESVSLEVDVAQGTVEVAVHLTVPASWKGLVKEDEPCKVRIAPGEG